jgi:hypothetical protein
MKVRGFYSTIILILLMAGILIGSQTKTACAVSPDIVISQVYGGGGNSGATYTHDFIELFNRGTATVSLAGWSVQYTSATGTGNFGSFENQITELPSVSLAPGKYLLIQEAQGTGGTTALPTPDLIDATPIPMSATGGKVALVNTATPLGCNGGSTPCSPAQLAMIIDLVGWDGANFFEGFPAPATTNTTAILRNSGGCSDTDNNGSDFTAGTPTPRNSDAPLNPCIHPSCALIYTPIYSIQGSGHSAAITGTVTTQGVVVGDFEGSASLGGFFMQDLAGDGDPTTSDGIFVYTSNADSVSVGQLVRVTGYARERFNQTTINGSDSNSSPVPTTNIVDCGTGTVAPTDVYMPFADDDYLERFEGMLVRFPQSLVISEYYNYDRFGEIVLALPLDGETRPFTPTAIEEPGAPAVARALANSLSRITLDDGLSAQNPSTLRHPNGAPFALDNRFRGGDAVQNTVGILGYDFSLYRIQPTAPAYYTSVNPRTATPEPVGGRLRVAAMNTLNFFITLDYPTGNPLDNTCGPLKDVECRGADSDQPDEFTRQRDKLLAALLGLDADIVGLTELENTTGIDPLGDAAYGIIPGLNAKLGPNIYAYIDTGVIGTDTIRVGLIYKPAKVTPVGAFKVLTSAVDPRFDDTKNRPVLAQTFDEVATGARFTVVVNHLKSKGSDCDDVDDPDTGDGQGNCNLTRTWAAQALVDWLATDPTGSGDPDFLILGDFNSYAQEDPVYAIMAGPDDIAGTGDDYTNLIQKFQGLYAYSYVFDSQAGYLDHALASRGIAGQVSGTTNWHINADEPDVLDYDTSFKPPEQDVLYEPNGFRSSDHDPVIVGLSLMQITITQPTSGQALQDGVTFQAIAKAASGIDGVTFYVCESNAGDSFPNSECEVLDAFDRGSNTWEYDFNTRLLPDGYYVIIAKAADNEGYEAWSPIVPFSIRNWGVVALLPSTPNSKAGRTMPVKFSLRVAESVDPARPFVANYELEVLIYRCSDSTCSSKTLMQTSVYGPDTTDYRISGTLYITNFKTAKQPAHYLVKIWRPSNNFMVGSFTFKTVK